MKSRKRPVGRPALPSRSRAIPAIGMRASSGLARIPADVRQIAQSVCWRRNPGGVRRRRGSSNLQPRHLSSAGLPHVTLAEVMSLQILVQGKLLGIEESLTTPLDAPDESVAARSLWISLVCEVV